MTTLVSILIAFAVLITVTLAQRCETPNNVRGQCISLYECRPLYDLVQQQPVSQEIKNFLQASQCQSGSGRHPWVCCNPFDTYKPIEDSGNSRDRPVISPSNGVGNQIPGIGQCGPTTTGNKIYNGNDTDIDEYPWMALLEYRNGQGKRQFGCGGMLINKRYVLTAAHCLRGEVERKVGTLISVRLGEWNTETDPDCINYRNGQECAPAPLDFGIETIVPHADYNDNNINRYHDIGLIRLAANVPYSDFVFPICLPSAQLRSAPGDKVVVSGWGRTLMTRRSAIKQKLTIDIADRGSCMQKFSVTTKNSIIDSQICAGGKFREDTCDGDSGGPLMKERGGSWFVEGIVSFGRSCGLEGWPGIYTRVNSYSDWIRQNLRP